MCLNFPICDLEYIFLFHRFMAQKFIFADEAGCFNFERKPNVSNYFILCTILMDECSVGSTLLELRRSLARKQAPLLESFHACEDKQVIRDAVYEAIAPHKFQIHATVMEKAKAQPQVRESKPRFYKHAWYYHFKHGVSKSISTECDPLVSAAALGTRKEKVSFTEAIADVMNQTVRAKDWSTDFRPAATDPCLQVADYCAWAIQRKWERGCERSYKLIADRISYEYELWKHGTTLYY